MTPADYQQLLANLKQKQPKVESKTMIALPLVVRQSTDEEKLNKTERRYLQHLRSFPFLWIGVQNITLKLADDTRFTPDFCRIACGGKMVFTDVKGFQRDDALVKIKVAARLFPFASFEIVKLIKGQWEVTEVKP